MKLSELVSSIWKACRTCKGKHRFVGKSGFLEEESNEDLGFEGVDPSPAV